jgi:hypothetical protein
MKKGGNKKNGRHENKTEKTIEKEIIINQDEDF